MILRTLAVAMSTAILFAGCTITFNTVQQEQFITVPSDTAIRVTPVDADAYERKYGKHEGVYLLNERSVHHYGQRFATRTAKTRRVRYVILDPNAQWLSTASYGFGPDEELTTFYAIVTSPEGTSRMYTRKDMVEEQLPGGGVRYRLAYPDVRRGTIIEEAYQTDGGVGHPDFNYATMLQFNLPCDTVRFRFDYPGWWTFKMKKTGPDDPPIFSLPTSRSDQPLSFTTERHNLPAIAHEPYSPYDKEAALYFEGMFDHIRYESHQGISYYQAPTTWDHVVKQLTQRILPRMPADWIIEEKVKEITNGITDKRKIVETVSAWLQDTINVVAPGESQSQYILDNYIGDPLAVCRLATEMLGELGIESRLYFIHSAEDGYFDRDFYDLSQFKIVAAAAMIDSVPVLFFPYQENVPIGFIPVSFRGESALVLERKADGLFQGRGIVRLDDDGASTGATEQSIVATIAEDGGVMVEERQLLRGERAVDLRDELNGMNVEKTRARMRQLIGGSDADMSLESYDVMNLKQRNEPLAITLRYKLNNAVTVTPDEVIFNTGGLLSPSSENHWKLDSTSRRSAIAIYAERHSKKNIRVVYPKSWRLQTTLADQKRANHFGEASSRYTRAEGELGVTLESVLKRSKGTKEQIGELCQLISAQSSLAVPTLVFAR